MVTVYLWDASTWTGVCGSLEDAQRHAAAHLGAGQDARIEAAQLVITVSSMSFCYERTGADMDRPPASGRDNVLGSGST
jgi:hypothetical protein